jgi:hypothetical protein
MIQIPKEELLESLKYGYNEFKTGMANGEKIQLKENNVFTHNVRSSMFKM